MLEMSTLSPGFQDEVSALIQSGLYESEQTFLADAVRTFLAARPDLRVAIACNLYKRGLFSLGRAAEWSDLSIEVMKETLHRHGIDRQASETPAETEAMARQTIQVAGRVVP